MKTYLVRNTCIAEPFQACENCGKLISYFAVLQEYEDHKATGKFLKTGLDCAETLKSKVPYIYGNYAFKASRTQRKLRNAEKTRKFNEALKV